MCLVLYKFLPVFLSLVLIGCSDSDGPDSNPPPTEPIPPPSIPEKPPEVDNGEPLPPLYNGDPMHPSLPNVKCFAMIGDFLDIDIVSTVYTTEDALVEYLADDTVYSEVDSVACVESVLIGLTNNDHPEGDLRFTQSFPTGEFSGGTHKVHYITQYLCKDVECPLSSEQYGDKIMEHIKGTATTEETLRHLFIPENSVDGLPTECHEEDGTLVGIITGEPSEWVCAPRVLHYDKIKVIYDTATSWY